MSGISLLEFADRLNQIMPVLMREFARRQTNELYKGQITLPQFIALEYLGKEGPLKMSDLARFMNVTTAAMTGIVERLVRDGYILRSYDANDRRIINVGLTKKAALLIRKINLERRSLALKIFGRITPEDRSDYLRILTQIHRIVLKNHLDGAR
jgi:DNA-binding MarR family transcriptional regulator